MSIYEDRNQSLLRQSQVVVNDTIQYKLDKVADIYINGLYHVTVFRRFNSVYEYIVECATGNRYLQKNGTLRTSLKSSLCLSEKEATQLYSVYAFSYKHNDIIDVSIVELADRSWSQVTKQYGAVCVNLSGIVLDTPRYDAYPQYDDVQSRIYSVLS